MTLERLPQGRLRKILRNGEPVVQFYCPGCGRWGDIDDDQLHGRVSVDHTDVYRGEIICTFHETRDWANTAEWE